MAVKQSLVGVCFVGVRRYMVFAEQNGDKSTIPLKLYYQWLGVAVQIQKINEWMNQRCEELQLMLSSSGFVSSILKGQGVAALYGGLGLLRQPGDIDVWCQGSSIKQLVEYLKGQGYVFHVTAAHVEARMFDGISVEFHAYPSFLKCPWKNKRLWKWIDGFEVESFDDSLSFRVPPVEFNVVFLLVHMYHHMLYEGFGLRQLMDYYFLLHSSCTENAKVACGEQLDRLRLSKFAGAVMWVLSEVFGLVGEKMVSKPDEKLGRLLLEEVMQGGNFGKYASEQKKLREKSVIIRIYNYTKRRLRFFVMAPEEVICTPFWSLWHYCLRKLKGYA